MERREFDFLGSTITDQITGLNVNFYKVTDRGVSGSKIRHLSSRSNNSEADDLVKIARDYLPHSGEPEVKFMETNEDVELITNNLNSKTIIQILERKGYISEQQYSKICEDLVETRNIPVTILTQVHQLTQSKTRKFAKSEIDKRLKTKKTFLNLLLGQD